MTARHVTGWQARGAGAALTGIAISQNSLRHLTAGVVIYVLGLLLTRRPTSRLVTGPPVTCTVEVTQRSGADYLPRGVDMFGRTPDQYRRRFVIPSHCAGPHITDRQKRLIADMLRPDTTEDDDRDRR